MSARRIAGGLVLGAMCGGWIATAACPAGAQDASSLDVPVVRGELTVRVDALLDVRVLAADPAQIPAGLWTRLEREAEVWVVGSGGDGEDARVRARMEAAPGTRTVTAAASREAAGATGFEADGEGGSSIFWKGCTQESALEILRTARDADEGFSLRILIPQALDFGDIWSLQAALSQAGIRRVQIVSGSN